MKRVQIFVDHDIIIRHFLHNRTFVDLEKSFRVQYVFPDGPKRVKTDVSTLGLKDYKIIPVDWRRCAMLRDLSKERSLRRARTSPKYRHIQRTYKMIMEPARYRELWLWSLPGLFQYHQHKVLKMAGGYAELEDAVASFDPDLILHPTVLEGYFITDLARVTRERQTPFLALMNSWDNPSTKAGALHPPDWLFVWGEQTRRHAVEFLGMRPERVEIAGAAQFEVYRQPPSKSKQLLCAEMGAPQAADKQLVLYAGSSKSVNEMDHLQLLDQAVASGQLAGCHIVFRPHPWRAAPPDEPDFFETGFAHVSMDPSMKPFYVRPKDRAEHAIHLTDYMDTHNILSAVDLLVSNMSTIFVEAALHGKPLLCLISDKDVAASRHLDFTVNSSYFQELLKRMDIPRCREAGALANLCRQQLDIAQAPGFAGRQRERVQYFVNMGQTPYPEKLTAFVDELLSKPYQGTC